MTIRTIPRRFHLAARCHGGTSVDRSLLQRCLREPSQEHRRDSSASGLWICFARRENGWDSNNKCEMNARMWVRTESAVVHSELIHVSSWVPSLMDVYICLLAVQSSKDRPPSLPFLKVARALNAMIHHVRNVCRPSGISCYLFWQNLTASTSEVLYSIFTSSPADLGDSFPRARKNEVSFEFLPKLQHWWAMLRAIQVPATTDVACLYSCIWLKK